MPKRSFHDVAVQDCLYLFAAVSTSRMTEKRVECTGRAENWQKLQVAFAVAMLCES